MKVLCMFNLRRLFTWVFVSQPTESVQRMCISVEKAPRTLLQNVCDIFEQNFVGWDIRWFRSEKRFVQSRWCDRRTFF